MLEQVIRNIIKTYEPVKSDWLNNHDSYSSLNLFISSITANEEISFDHPIHLLGNLIANLMLEILEIPENKQDNYYHCIKSDVFQWTNGYIDSEELVSELLKYKVKKQP